MDDCFMHIGLVVPGFSGHADAWSIPALQHLAVALAKRARVSVFSQRYPAAGCYRFEGVTHYALGAGMGFGLNSIGMWWCSVAMLVQHHRRQPFDLLHAFWADEAGFAAVVAGAIIKRPVIISLGGWELTNLPAIDYGAQRLWSRRLTVATALRLARVVTAGSHYQLDLARRYGLPEDKLRFAPLGVDTTHFHPAHSKMAGPPSLIQAASLVPVKNQALLLQLLSRIKAVIPAIQLHLVGAGPLQPTLETLAEAWSLTPNIIWQQHVLHLQLPRLYQQADLYLQTSYHESQGMSVLEALACGLPLVGTPVGVGRDLACLPPATEATALAEQAIQVLQTKHSQPEQYQRWSQQARSQVVESFSLAVSQDTFLALYETFLT
jgi:glycosyltransferase involved in cell wall biosynthesis